MEIGRFSMEWIDKIYIISLEKHKNRRESIMLDLSSAGFNMKKVEVITAVDGNNLDISECLDSGKISDTFIDPYGNLTKSIYGCALSHLAAYRKLLDSSSDIQNCLILEDDATLSHTLLRVLLPNSFSYKKLLEEKESIDWDVILLGGQEKQMEYEHTNSYVLKTTKRYPINYAAHSYIITRKGAELLIRSNTPIRFAADVNIHCSSANLYSTPSSYFLQKNGNFDKWMAVLLEQSFRFNILDRKAGWDSEEIRSTTTFGDYSIDCITGIPYKSAQISNKIDIEGINWESFIAPNGDKVNGWANIRLKK
jgi:GR25 family glycosyltransferase involved in LPS biosynthesis